MPRNTPTWVVRLPTTDLMAKTLRLKGGLKRYAAGPTGALPRPRLDPPRPPGHLLAGIAERRHTVDNAETAYRKLRRTAEAA
jgi:hypothetical protein